jgi:predicted RNase H-like HicB family nuclease
MSVRKMTFEVLFCIEKDGEEFHAFCPNLKGLHTSGRTEKEALENVKSAFEAYIESLLANHEPIPLTMISEERKERKDKSACARPFPSVVEVAV